VRAITIKQPWAAGVMLLGKVENRGRLNPWGSAVGQRLAIHAGKGWDRTAPEELRTLDLAHVSGAVLGTALLRDVHWCSDVCGPYAIPRQIHLVFSDPAVLSSPPQAVGMLGLWTWDHTSLPLTAEDRADHRWGSRG
jgi:hypothetical protein